MMRPEEIAALLDAEPGDLLYLPDLLGDLEALGSFPELGAELLESAGLEEGERVLDLGCGKGAVALAVARRLPVEVLGVDAFPPFIEAARRRAEELGLAGRCRFEVGDLRHRLQPREPFDALVWASMGPILGGVRRTVERLAGAARPGGWILLDDCYLAPGVTEAPPGYESYLFLEETREALRGAGVAILQEVPVSQREVRELNRRSNEAIRRRGAELVAAKPETVDLVRRYVRRQDAECRRLEEHTRAVLWLLEVEPPGCPGRSPGSDESAGLRAGCDGVARSPSNGDPSARPGRIQAASRRTLRPLVADYGSPRPFGGAAMSRSVLVATAVTLILLTPVSGAIATEITDLGSVDFPNSGAAEAQEAFVRGVLLLHSFEYSDAREAFRAARELDPDFALAYWGEAMTYNHPLWRSQDREAAQAVLRRLGETPYERLAAASTERERGYLEALEALYFGEGDKLERDLAYERAMAALAAAYPRDLEARAFHALSILGTTQGVRNFRTYMRAGAIAEEVFAASPRHPGAVHYMIHSYDDPIHAPLGLRAARVYARIAPAASHAQHMISHIYVALGMWEESLEANEISYEVSVERADRKDLGLDARNYHAFQWLHYSLLQLGRHAQAREELERMHRMAAETRTPRSLWYHASMRATHLVATDGAGPLPPGLPIPADEEGDPESLMAEVLDAFGSGYAALRAEGDLETGEDALARLEEVLAVAASRTKGEGYVGSFTEEDRQAVRVMALELEALLQRAAGLEDAALASLEEAAALEAARPLEYGPPIIVKPAHELLGEILLAMERPGEALQRFEEALERAPRRTLSLAGRARAAEELGEAELAARTCEELRHILLRADVEARPGVCGGPLADEAP